MWAGYFVIRTIMEVDMKRLIAKYILYPLTYRNYRLRESGKLPDKWYWADTLLIKWGFLWRPDNWRQLFNQQSNNQANDSHK